MLLYGVIGLPPFFAISSEKIKSMRSPCHPDSKKFCRIYRSRPLEHGSALQKEAPRLIFSDVLFFDLKKYPKIWL